MNTISKWTRWLAGVGAVGWALLALGCGGGGSTTVAGLPGTGGTGYTPTYTSTGTIKGFGSVKVNGVFYDDSKATVHVDGQTLTPAALGLGMVVTVQGQLGTVAGTGTADVIEVWSQAQGTLSALSGNRFQVAGMNVSTDSGTVYQGVASSAALSAGMSVRVWAFSTDVGQTQWLATRVEVLNTAPAKVVSTGIVGTGGTQLNGLTLTGSLVPLVAGQSVRVSGTLSGTQLTVTAVRSSQAAPAADSKEDEEFEGVVTQMTSSTSFLIGNSPVDASKAIVSGGSVTVGAKAEVKGRWVSGVFQAREVELESEQDLTEVEIKGEITVFNSLADFTVRGQRCDASGITKVDGGSLTDLKLGVRVQLHGVKKGDVVQVTEIELDD